MTDFGLDLIQPSYNRDPWFAGAETVDQVYRWCCASCQSDVEVPLNGILREVWSWQTTIGDELAKAAHAHFGLNIVGRSHDGGWPSIMLVQCASCDASYLLYAGVDETSNSVYRVTIQGLCEVRGLTLMRPPVVKGKKPH